MERAKTWRRPRRTFRRFTRPKARGGAAKLVSHPTGRMLRAFPSSLLVVLRDDLRGARAFHALAELVERAERLGSFERALVCRARPGTLAALRQRGEALEVREGKKLVALAFLPRRRWPAVIQRLRSAR